MVVVTASANTSSPKQKKTRRSQKKGKSKTNQGTQNSTVDNGDEDMDDGLLPTDTSGRSNEQAPPQNAEDDVLMIDPSVSETIDTAAFPPLPASAHASSAKSETRRIPIPPHRMTPLTKDWINIFSPLTEMLGLQVRMNVPRKAVEMRVQILSC